jgi:dethiobiotin synthetase
MEKIFITGIGTDVGKTIVSAIITESLQADYWKPIQAGELDNSDSHKVKELISNDKTIFHGNSYAFINAESPHSAAKKENRTINLKEIIEPQTSNYLVIEGAGGVLVPLNDTYTIIDLIKPDYKVIVVSQNYLGSINHTLLTINALKSKGVNVSGIIFNGEENIETQSIIKNMTGVKVIGRVEKETVLTKEVIKKYAALFREKLNNL